MKQNHLLKIGFVIFLKGATFSDFVDYRLLNYIPTGIQICIPLFWGKIFQLGSSLITQWQPNVLKPESIFFECREAANEGFKHPSLGLKKMPMKYLRSALKKFKYFTCKKKTKMSACISIKYLKNFITF